MTPNTIQLDHAILLLPYKDITNPPDWLTKNFIISPGGLHADGKTENRLVIFRDGTYLELIAFVSDDPERRKGHWWDKPFGVVDFAFTTPESFDFAALLERLQKSGTGVEYAKPQAGGRARPDGVELKWKVTFPKGAERGEVPFWCHDVTPRERRVPITEASTNHPSGALGMSGVLLKVDGSKLESLVKALSAITNSKQLSVGTPNSVDGLRKPSVQIEDDSKLQQGHALSLVLQTPGKEPPTEIKHKVGDGVVSIVFEK